MTPKELAQRLRELFKDVEDETSLENLMEIRRSIFHETIAPNLDLIIAALEAYEPVTKSDGVDALEYAVTGSLQQEVEKLGTALEYTSRVYHRIRNAIRWFADHSSMREQLRLFSVGSEYVRILDEELGPPPAPKEEE